MECGRSEGLDAKHCGEVGEDLAHELGVRFQLTGILGCRTEEFSFPVGQ